MQRKESVPAILESEATGEIADIYADIRQVLGTSVVNLIWRNLATMPGALKWTWSNVKELYQGPAPEYAEAVRRTIDLPFVPSFSADTLATAGLSDRDLSVIKNILDSYYYTNALALVALSALIVHYEPTQQPAKKPWGDAPRTPEVALPELPPLQSLDPVTARLIEELNGFGEDSDRSLLASMYRHLGYWPVYLSLVRTALVPLEVDGRLQALTHSSRAMAQGYGRGLSQHLKPSAPPDSLKEALAACRRFVEHPIARMTGICALLHRMTE